MHIKYIPSVSRDKDRGRFIFHYKFFYTFYILSFLTSIYIDFTMKKENSCLKPLSQCSIRKKNTF